MNRSKPHRLNPSDLAKNTMKPIAQLAPIEASLKELSEKVGTIQNALPKGRKSAANAKSIKSPSLEATCREAAKVKQEIVELENEYEDTLGLKSVPANQRTALLAATEVRGRASKAYVQWSGLSKQIKAILNSVRDKLADDQLKEIEGLEEAIKETGVQIQKFVLDMVPLGMAVEEWEEVSLAERRSLRSPGRPKPPLEAQIAVAKRTLQDRVAFANRLSGGKLRTEEEVLAEVKTTGRGRPQVSELGKLDRQINTLRKKLEELSKEDPATPMHEIKQKRLVKQINALQEEITQEENALEGVDLLRRTLEKLRAKHRAIVVAEVKAVGQEQAQLLLSLLRNENEQRDIATEIRKLDPQARLSLTQKINPTQTRKRFERLRMNGRLKDEEIQEVEELRRTFEEFTFSRNR